MSSALPLVFTLPPSNRHEILLLDTSSSLSLKALNKQIGTAMASSPNCAAFMGKFKAADAPAEQIQEMRLRWDTKGRDAKVWPEGTVVTEENLPAILELLKRDPTMGVLEIKTGKQE